MRKIIGEKSKIINKIYIMSLFLVLGVLRPIIIKFFNLDIFMVVATVFLLLMIVNVMLVKVTIPQKSCILDHSVNTFCMGAILIIIRNGSGIISPILSIFTCILIGLSYSEKFKVSKFMEPTAYIVIIGVVGLSFIYFTQGFQYNKQIEEPSKESKRNTIEEDKQIKDKIENMTLEEKIGQMIVAGFNGTKVNEEVNTLVKDLKVGGVILFSRNIENSAQLKNLNDNISKLNKDIELFISIDEEGGRVTRLPSDTIKFKSAKEIGETGDLDYAYENGENIGMTLKEHGFNMDFAPVLDIYSNPKNTVIGDRAFGSDEKIVSDMGIATMKGIEEGCVVPVVKHFPGHGDTEVDSHFGLPIVTKDLKELEKFEFIPFKKAIKEGCDVVMVSHIILDKIDDKNPATLSKTVVTDILRDDLEFEGVVITDDMHMKAITENISIEKASVDSINAGVDIILIGSNVNSTKSTIEEIKKAVENDEISEKRIDESVYRILKLKDKYKLSTKKLYDK